MVQPTITKEFIVMTATILNTANSELQNEYDDDAELQAAIDAKYCK